MTILEMAAAAGLSQEDCFKALKEVIRERLDAPNGLAEVIPISPKQYSRLKKVDAIEAYLRARGGSATYEDLIRALRVGGCRMPADCKDYYRVIRIAVAQNSGRLVDAGGGVVRLEERSKPRVVA